MTIRFSSFFDFGIASFLSFHDHDIDRILVYEVFRFRRNKALQASPSIK
jgi:hypothetical protein